MGKPFLLFILSSNWLVLSDKNNQKENQKADIPIQEDSVSSLNEFSIDRKKKKNDSERITKKCFALMS